MLCLIMATTPIMNSLVDFYIGVFLSKLPLLNPHQYFRPFGIAFTDFYGFLNFICLNCDNYAIVYTSLPEADRTSFHMLRFSPW